MKLKITYIGIVLMFFIATAINAQSQPNSLKRNADGSVANDKPATVNPAKIDPATQTDLKIDPNQHPASPTNWKPGQIPVEDRKIMEPEKTVHPVITDQSSGAQKPQQPAGLKAPAKAPEQKLKYEKTQPEGVKPTGNVRKTATTAPGTQPEGSKPN